MNKLSLIVAGLLLSSSMTFAMEPMASTSMIKDKMMDKKMEMMDKATGTMMKDKVMDKMMDKASTTMMKKEMRNDMKADMKESMKKCIDIKKATRKEVRTFQKENGIVATGFIGKLTKAKLAKMNCMMDEIKKATTTPTTTSN